MFVCACGNHDFSSSQHGEELHNVCMYVLYPVQAGDVSRCDCFFCFFFAQARLVVRMLAIRETPTNVMQTKILFHMSEKHLAQMYWLLLNARFYCTDILYQLCKLGVCVDFGQSVFLLATVLPKEYIFFKTHG